LCEGEQGSEKMSLEGGIKCGKREGKTKEEMKELYYGRFQVDD